MSLNLAKTVVEFLKNRPEEKFTARDIATWIFEKFPDQCKAKQLKSTATVIPINTESGLIQQLVAEIGSQRPRIQQKNPEIKTTDGRPRKFYFSTLSDEAEIASSTLENSKEGRTTSQFTFNETELYPMLSQYLWHEHKIYPKRIDEKRSKNTQGSGGNKWLFPDLVGLEDLSQDWDKEIKNLVQQAADQKAKLWSFEVKKLINRSNVREVYFQAVSNSSWANLGYLAAAEIQGAEKELRILSGLHGIGVIKIDVENPSDSEILIPARIRPDVDWNAANRLAKENFDFLEYIKLIRQFYQTGEHRQKDWDLPADLESL